VVELAAVQQLVAAVGPIGAMVVIGAWWFVSHQEKRNGAKDQTARLKARDAIIQISADVGHMKKDIADIKADGKTTATTLMQHVAQQHTRGR